MNFNEIHDFSIKLDYDLNYNTFIYFLLKLEEVVYVGQTTRGIKRPLEHLNSGKIFDEIKIIYCSESELNEYEYFFIEKYKPVYNLSNIRFGKRNKKPDFFEVIRASKMLNIYEACNKLNISKNKLIKMMDNGEIKYFKINRTVRIEESEVERLQKGE